ncbi:Uncharacterised protein [Mycobacteroides abscessus subsp. abscessus]|nr:Uncharacterised protein [Mycobacteroides abscessus subsp. abscessus]
MTGECEVAEMVGAELQFEPVGSGLSLGWGHHTCVVDQQMDGSSFSTKFFTEVSDGYQ